MALVDEDGRLFGVVNVVDAVVVVLVVVFLASSVAFVLFESNEDPQPAVSRSGVVTMDVPAYAASGITPGDNSTLVERDGRIVFEDVWVGPNGTDSRVTLFAAVNLTAPASDTEPSQFAIGETLQLQSALSYNATVVSVGDSPDGFGEQRHVLARTTVSTETANAVHVGDRYRLAGRTVGEVADVTAYPTAADRRTLLLELTLTTRSSGDGRYFGSHRLAIGRTVPFETATYSVSPQIVAIGDEDGVRYGNRTETTAIVELDGVSQDTADSVTTGMSESSHGVTTATIVNKSVEPTTVTVTSSDGQIYAREHPTQKTVSLTVDLRTRRTESGLRFHGRPLHANENVSFDFGNTTITGRVVEIEE
jgi:hypothetical protein